MKELLALMICGLLASSALAADFTIGERLQAAPAPKVAGVRQLKWEDLIPGDWKPEKLFKDLNLDQLKDGDPRAVEALAKMRAAWDAAPAVTALNGQRVKLSGFMVMLDSNRRGVTEFLLVPYFGACIHIPAPPSNQIVHVFPDMPVPDKIAMAPVWVTGLLQASSANTSMGSASYRIEAALVEAY